MLFAIITRNCDLVRAVQRAGLDQQLVVEQYADDAGFIRALRSRSFSMIFVDAATQYSRNSTLYQWRQTNRYDIPLMVVGSFASVHAMQAALESDAADIVTGPVDDSELTARLMHILRRQIHPKQTPVIRLGRYTLDQRSCQITLDNQVIALTAREYQLAATFLANPGIYFSREQLSRIVWPNTREVAERSLEQYIYKLRKKLRLSSNTGLRLRTLYSVGYRLEAACPPQPQELGATMEAAPAQHPDVHAAPAPAGLTASTIGNALPLDISARTDIGA